MLILEILWQLFNSLLLIGLIILLVILIIYGIKKIYKK